MAGNARGKLKEQVEGLHNNFDAARFHCEKAILILEESHPELQEMFRAIAKEMSTLDAMAADIFSRL